ncbi:hypothetical protein IAD21_04577 [Abditibacteriota bacterium]|nr:hypothetical protein IAD21_04577 [Abditibacteriota bacterium]
MKQFVWHWKQSGIAAVFALILVLLFPSMASAQTLGISGGVQTYSTLTNTAVTMTGKSELHVTGTSSPIAGTTINLNSPDAWFWLDNIRPQTVNSTYLSQIRISGSAAVQGTNVRVVQYALGTVVIPHAPSYQPLQAWSGPNFSGTSQKFSLYTYYNTAAALGVLNSNVSSFKLKRGYMATFATQANGTGSSKVYVAQDSDVEVSLLPDSLNNAIQFVRVFPWRWVSKKGSCDVSADTLNSAWFYNWNNNQSSSLNWEYVPIRQQRWWPGYPTNKPDSTHLSGYNEPNNPVEDAYKTLNNGSVDAAISAWPELLECGLRVGSPAVTDGGESWLYSFMDKAKAANLRVDYVTIHFYRAGYSSTQLYNWLKGIHDRTGKPIWVTEFNNGANWTSGADPTLQQNATVIGSFINMMNSTPWIERYAVYSNVEDVRKMVDSSGNLTPAGTVYKNTASPIGYIQEPTTSTEHRGIAHLPFDGNALDTSGYNNDGTAVDNPTYTNGSQGQAIQLDGANSYVQMPTGMASGASFSFAGWIYWDGGSNWQRIFDFGNGSSQYLFLTPQSGSGTLRFAIKNGGAEQIVETSALPTGKWTHVALTLTGGVAKLYVDGALKTTNSAVTIKPGDFSPAVNYIGKSQFSDPLFKGRLDDVYIADSAFTAAQIAAMMTNTAPQFTSTTIYRGPAHTGVALSATLAGAATDPDAGDSITYSKTSGPSWLTVATNGTLSGTPSTSVQGTQEFVVTATDSKGASASVNLFIYLAEFDGVYSLTPKHVTGKVLDVLNANPADGASLVINTYTGASSQRFMVEMQSDGTYRIRTSLTGNRAVNLPNGTTTNGTKIKLGDDTGNDSQRWVITQISDGWYQIAPKNNLAKGIDVNGASTQNGALVQSWDYSGGTNQLWHLTPSTELYSTELPDGLYRLMPRHATGKALAVLNNDPNNSASLGIWTTDKSDSQKFLVDVQSDGTYRIRTNLTGNRAVELPSGTTTNGTKIKLWDNNNLAPQRWYLIPLDNGWYKIAPKGDITKSMDVNGVSTQDGALVQSWDYWGGTGQQWQFTLASIPNVAPTISSVSITPVNPTTNSMLAATVSASDANDDTLTYSYVWKKNDIVLGGETGSMLDLSTVGNGDRGDKITVTATVNDGTVNSAAMTAEAVTIGNSAPVVSSVNLTPSTPGTNSTLSATVSATDADGDNVTYTYVWKKNGSVIAGETGATLDLSKSGNGDDGDSITATVTANDGSADSVAVTSGGSIINTLNTAPSVVSISPSSATDTVGNSRTFTVTVSDGNGVGDIKNVWFLANTVLDWSDGATLVYDKVNNQLFLRDNDHFNGPITPGSGTLSNGAVTIVGSSVVVTPQANGTTLAITFAMQVKNGMVGTNGVWGRVEDLAGTTDQSANNGQFGFVQKATWRVNGTSGTQQAPTLTVTPGVRGTITPETVGSEFNVTLDLTDANGLGDIQSAYILVNDKGNFGWSNGFTLYYEARTNRLYLRSTDGNSFLGGFVVGQGTGTLENEAGSIRLSGCTMTPITNGVRLVIVVTPKSALVGTKQVWTRIQDLVGNVAADSNVTFGFKSEGLLVISNAQEAKPSASVSIAGTAAGIGTSHTVATATETTFTLNLSDTDGAGELKSGWLLINQPGVLDWTNCIALVYEARNNVLRLRSTDGSRFSDAIVGTTTGTLSNGAVSIRLSGTSVTRTAQGITLTLAVTPKAGFTGTKQIWSRVEDTVGNVQAGQDAAQGYNTEGTVQITNNASVNNASATNGLSSTPSAPNS